MDFEWIWELRCLQNRSQKSFDTPQNLSKTLPITHLVLSIQNDALPLTHYPITRPGGMGVCGDFGRQPTRPGALQLGTFDGVKRISGVSARPCFIRLRGATQPTGAPGAEQLGALG